MGIDPPTRGENGTAALDVLCWRFAKVVLRRNSCVTAIPILANAKLVRSQARKVLSNARWSLATEPLFSSDTEPYFSANRLYQGSVSSCSGPGTADPLGLLRSAGVVVRCPSLDSDLSFVL